MQDNSSGYEFSHEGLIPDIYLTEQYETNGLFAKIIDTPAEEAVKHGFSLGLNAHVNYTNTLGERYSVKP
jgi:hypothetical protein